MLFSTNPSWEEFDSISVNSSVKTEWIRQAIPFLIYAKTFPSAKLNSSKIDELLALLKRNGE